MSEKSLAELIDSAKQFDDYLVEWQKKIISFRAAGISFIEMQRKFDNTPLDGVNFDVFLKADTPGKRLDWMLEQAR
jgi:hypothetical protein